MLQITRDAFISGALSLAPGRICMISSHSQIVPVWPVLTLDFRSRSLSAVLASPDRA
jgi:hypothetical protein